MKISLVETTSIIVFITPERLREIADSLEAQQERYDVTESGKLNPLNQEPEDNVCHLHGGNINLWFRLPHHNTHLT